jgi:hypothetical protein
LTVVIGSCRPSLLQVRFCGFEDVGDFLLQMRHLPWQDAPQFLADPTSVQPLQPLGSIASQTAEEIAKAI